jgi:hypothetical protein
VGYKNLRRHCLLLGDGANYEVFVGRQEMSVFVYGSAIYRVLCLTNGGAKYRDPAN